MTERDNHIKKVKEMCQFCPYFITKRGNCILPWVKDPMQEERALFGLCTEAGEYAVKKGNTIIHDVVRIKINGNWVTIHDLG